MANGNVRAAKATADLWFSRAVRTMGKCEHCGIREQLSCSHIISRKYNQTRTSYRNAHCLCFSCHRRFTDNPVLFGEWVSTTWAKQYLESERTKAYDNMATKIDWKDRTEIAKQIVKGTLTLEDARQKDL